MSTRAKFQSFNIGLALSVATMLLVCSSIEGRDKAKKQSAAIQVILPDGYRVHDLDGRQLTLLGSADCRGLALIFLSTECPMCHEQIPQLNKLTASYKKLGLEVYGIITDRTITRQQAKEHAEKFQLKFGMILDSAHALRDLTGATHTPEAFVFDRHGKLAYRGLIDDSVEQLGKKNKAKKHYLADALKGVAAGNKVAITQTAAVGCLIEEAASDASSSDVTFNRDIAPVLFSNCVTCHREGEVAPFAMTEFSQVSKRAKQIAEVVTSRIMPPWRPVPDYGHFAGERRLSEGQIALLNTWAESGAIEGDPADLPPMPQFPRGWQLGKPDMIVKMVRPFHLPADGPDLYQHFVAPMNLNQDRLIRAIEVHPGNARIVHHAHLFVDTTGEARQLDLADPNEGYTRFGGTGLSSPAYLGGWNPGATPHFFPKGCGRQVPRGGDAVFQIHYHPSGKPETDQTEIGIYFAPADAQQLIADLVVGNTELVIPAGTAEARFTAEYTTPANVVLMEIRPHMHLLGKSYQVRGILPSGAEVPLIKIDNWDFNWQDSYVFDPMIRLPAGSKIQVQAVFDNSSSNPANPSSPPQTVYFGEESTDEMSSCAIRVTTDTYAEFQQVTSDNGKYWVNQIQKYLERNMTPDKKLRDRRPVKSSSKGG